MPLPQRFSHSLELRFKILETEHEIRQMESDIDFSKEQTLLIREAIKEKQRLIEQLRPRLQRFRQREEHHNDQI